MNKYKLIIIMLLLVILTGCQADYKVKILLDGRIEESAVLLEEKESLLDEFNNKKFKTYVDESLKINGLEDVIKNRKMIFEEDEAGVNLSRKYSDIFDYKRKSKAINYLFKGIDVEEKKKIVKIESIPSNYDIINYNDYDHYRDSFITVMLPYKVISSNADFVSENDNSYTWLIGDKIPEIKMEYDSSKLYTYNFMNLITFFTFSTFIDILVILIIVVSVLAIIVFGIILLKRNKK